MSTNHTLEILDSPVALVVAHPGHELRVWRWLELLRPEVLVVTNGSGREGVSRIATTGRLIKEAGARRGRLFGQLADRELYQAVLMGDAELFGRLTKFLADELTRLRIRTVLGDAAEGIIMAHDLLREVRRAAVAIAEQRLGWRIAQYEFPLDSHPAAGACGAASDRRTLQLTTAELARKLHIAGRYQEIATLVQTNLENYGAEAFGLECLFPCVEDSSTDAFVAEFTIERPQYEIHGEDMVRQGRYTEVIRYRTHVLPLVESVRALAWSAV